MNRRGLKWAAAGTEGLVLIVLGIHFAWEWHRYRLVTPQGTFWVGMTRAEVAAVFGKTLPPTSDVFFMVIDGEFGALHFGDNGTLREVYSCLGTIPRPSLVAHVRAWFASKLGK